jgi:hypothetical protein
MNQVLRTKLNYVVAVFLVARSRGTDYGVIWSLVMCMNKLGIIGILSTRP